MVCLELYEIVHERNPLRRLCRRMISGRMKIPWYYTSVLLHFAGGAGSRSFSLNTDYRDDEVQLDDTTPRWWFPLRRNSSYHSAILQNIAQSERQSSVHGRMMLPLSKMLYDMILYKMLYYETPCIHESWRQELEPVMLRYLARHTIDQEAKWVDQVIEEGWTCTEGKFV